MEQVFFFKCLCSQLFAQEQAWILWSVWVLDCGLDKLGFKYHHGKRDVSVTQTVQTSAQVHLARVQGVPGWISQVTKLITHHSQVLRLKMNGGISLLPICTFVAFTGTTLHSYFYLFIQDEDNAHYMIKMKLNLE
jgi:hypothetical protein